MIQINTAKLDVVGQENYKEIASNVFLKDDGTVLISDGKEAITIVTAQRLVTAQ